MTVLTYIIMGIQMLCAIALVVIVTMQSGKNSGLSSVVGGGSETFLGKGKAKSWDAKLASMTKWIALAFVVLTFVLNLL
ncbi:MAG: preprotein translocase subunit SecG [Oscillospiraceae bacterium]|nr:preprotein translocase subunit SecG [Oscillospiraceae bacterium]